MSQQPLSFTGDGADFRVVSLLLASCALVLGCAKNEGVVHIDGSSTVFPIMGAVATQFQKAETVKVAVAVSGTRGGFRKLCAGELDIAGASRPINTAESADCRQNGVEFIELPIAYDGISVLVNPENDWAKDITLAELRKVWSPAAQGQTMRWSQVRAGWPDDEIHLYGAGADSGTYDYFTEAVVGTEHTSRTDYVSSEDDEVLVTGVARDRLALGFFGYVYFAKNNGKLKALAVDDENPANGKGPILPSAEAIRNGTYQPFSRPLFLYAATKSLQRGEVALFLDYYLQRGWRIVDGVGYVPLPAAAYGLATERLSARRTGSLFDGRGSAIGVRVDELLQTERNEGAKL